MIDRGPEDTARQAAEKLTRARAWASMRYPFLAVLALHLPDRAAPGRPGGAGTDGRSLWYDPHYLAALPDTEVRGLLLHLVLHAALGHAWRRGGRDPARWERACDIVVNGIVRRTAGADLPSGANTIDPALEESDVEAVFALLPAGLEPPAIGATSEAALDQAEAQGLDAYWADARRAAAGVGDEPRGLNRHYANARPTLDWRARLSRYLTTAMLDYSWSPPDRRMLAHDVIYPSLAGESAWVAVAVDTSGSVPEEAIGSFLGEVSGIARSHPDVGGIVIYSDSRVAESHDLRSPPPPTVRGGGGTSFEPALRELERLHAQPQVLVYLTDGLVAQYPPRPPYPVVWVLARPPGVDVPRPPYGEVLYLGP